MKKLFFIILILGTFNIYAQEQNEKVNPKLEALQKEKDQAILKEKINALENGTADDLGVLIEYYHKDSARKAAVTQKLLKKYPESDMARMLRMASFIRIEGGPEAEAALNAMIKEYPGINLDMETSLVALTYAEVPDTVHAMRLINSIKDPLYKVAAISNMLTDVIAPINNALALDIAARELGKANEIKDGTKPGKFLQLNPKTVYIDYINTYGKLLFKAGQEEKAYQYTKIAYSNMQEKDQELIENYALLSSRFDGNYAEALPILSNMIKEGKNDQRYIDQVKMGYQKLNPDKDANAYITALQKEFIAEIRSNVQKLMKNEAAPNFEVTDVNGKKVTLADFKGKTIVLDFWATWCMPCVASFPAMQLAANKYANDPSVKFLFIHTFNNVADPLTDAKQFLRKRNYNFDLYIDARDNITKESPAANTFKLTGIPTKFVIDANGKVRFEVSGFSGTDEAAAEELTQMIELTRKGA